MFKRLKILFGRKGSEKAYRLLEFPFNFYALLLSKYGEVRYLHYGFWDSDSDISILTAQERLAERLYGLIPQGVHSILDVGCGLGTSVCELLHRGYNPEGISPDEGLVNYAKATHKKCADRFYITTFEEYKREKQYDLLLFCESAQYIKDKQVLFSRAKNLLRLGGYTLLCDEFLKRFDERANFHIVS
ncbi:MAG: methyltransferase domain-containing protein, partial [Aquificota bacterium]